MTTPTTLQDLSGFGWGDLTHSSSDSNYHYYNHSWDTSNNHGVRVKFTTGTGYNIWTDGTASAEPNYIDDNSDGYVYARNSGNTLLIKFLKPTSTTASWISSGGGTSTEGVNQPYVTWSFPHRSCGQHTYVSVTHTQATSSATTYTVHDDTGQIGSILVGTGATATANFQFTISSRTLQVKDPSGSVIGTRVFTCTQRKKVHCNFW